MVNKSKKNYVAKRDVFKWTDLMDDAFIDALIRQQKLGNRVDSVFTTAAYDNMVKELRQKIGMPFEKDHLKNRMKTLKNNFKGCFDLFNGAGGFVWSPEYKMWSAKPESWKAFTKAKPSAKKWMTTPIPHYDKLFLLFAKDKAKSNGDITAKENKPGQWATSGSPYLFDGLNLPNEVTLNLEDLNEMNDGTSQLATPVEANSQADSQGRSHSATSSKGKKRKASSADVIERDFKSIRDAIKDVAHAIREGNLVAERGRPRVYSEQEVFSELTKIGLETHLRYKAYIFLVANAGRVRAFFGCPPEERRELLLHMMYSPDVAS